MVNFVDRLTGLPDALRAWRKQRDGISQETLAARVGVTPGMIALIETGRRQPGLALLVRIAEVLDVPPTALAFVPVEPDTADTGVAA
jgi:transcriptional regulator with XRE-family HTH domain